MNELQVLFEKMGETGTNFALIFDWRYGYAVYNFIDGEVVDEIGTNFFDTPTEALKDFYFTEVKDEDTETVSLDIEPELYQRLLKIAGKNNMLVDELVANIIKECM